MANYSRHLSVYNAEMTRLSIDHLDVYLQLISQIVQAFWLQILTHDQLEDRRTDDVITLLFCSFIMLNRKIPCFHASFH